MPIEYGVADDGHFVHAVASGEVTEQEFVEYEAKHTSDARVKFPFKELLEIRQGSFRQVTRAAVERLVASRGDSRSGHLWHHCAIVVSYSDGDAWELAKLYERLVSLHSPCTVIVFGDAEIARTWLGVSPL